MVCLHVCISLTNEACEHFGQSRLPNLLSTFFCKQPKKIFYQLSTPLLFAFHSPKPSTIPYASHDINTRRLCSVRSCTMNNAPDGRLAAEGRTGVTSYAKLNHYVDHFNPLFGRVATYSIQNHSIVHRNTRTKNGKRNSSASSNAMVQQAKSKEEKRLDLKQQLTVTASNMSLVFLSTTCPVWTTAGVLPLLAPLSELWQQPPSPSFIGMQLPKTQRIGTQRGVRVDPLDVLCAAAVPVLLRLWGLSDPGATGATGRLVAVAGTAYGDAGARGGMVIVEC